MMMMMMVVPVTYCSLRMDHVSAARKTVIVRFGNTSFVCLFLWLPLLTHQEQTLCRPQRAAQAEAGKQTCTSVYLPNVSFVNGFSERETIKERAVVLVVAVV